MKIVIFDLETKLSPGTDCKWEEKDKMGISVGVGFSYETGEQTVYLDDNIEALWASLVSADLVSGFNINDFDIPLIYAQMIKQYAPLGVEHVNDPQDLVRLKEQRDAIVAKSYDILVESRKGTKFDRYVKGFRVDDHLKSLFGDKWMKTGDGAMAPQLYKDKKMGELISYCMGDVHRERLLFEQCWYAGVLKTVGYKGGEESYSVALPQTKLGVAENWRLPYTMFPTTNKGIVTIAEKFVEPPHA